MSPGTPPRVPHTAALDPGQKRVGIAISDDILGIAMPIGVVERTKEPEVFFERLRSVLSEYDVAQVIIGLPLRLNGTEGMAARRVRKFGRAVAEATGWKVKYWDERLTTLAAEQALKRLGVSSKKQRAVVDETAATLILQSYLDANRK